MMSLLFSAAWKGTVILACAGLCVFARRRTSAATRHGIWALAFASLLALPLLPWVLPVWTPPPAIAQSAATLLSLEVGSGATAPGVNWRDWLPAVWLAGFVVVFLRLLIGMATVRQMVRRAKVDGHAEEITILTSDGAGVPLTWGWLHPVILLPARSQHWAADLRRNVLLHELGHVRRNDWLTRMLAQVAASVYWFHPLVWVALRELVKASERACDDEVLRAGAKASDYASHLLLVARSRGRQRVSWAAVSMARPSQLEGRLLAILDLNCNRRALTARAGALAVLVGAALVLPLAAVGPVDEVKGGIVGGVAGGVVGGSPEGVVDGVIGGVVGGVPGGVVGGVAAGQAEDQRATTAPRIVHRVNPQYTEEARQKKIEGEVNLTVDVDPEGKPSSVRVSKSLDPGLDQKAVEAVQQWRWEPGKKNGKPVTVRAKVTIRFSLTEPSAPQRVRVYPVGGDITAPRLISKVEPEYTQEARDAHIQGEVALYVEVWPDGGARNIRVEKSLDAGLDQKAIEAVRQWRFEPATKDGERVPVGATVVVNFRLR